MKWICNNNIISEDMIKKVEGRIGIAFPQDFLEIIIKYDGGHPFPNKIDINGSGEVLNNLVSFNESSINYILSIIEDEEFLPEKLIPIAEDPFGNLFCYKQDNNRFRIMFWDHETNKEKYVCDNFKDLIEQLY